MEIIDKSQNTLLSLINFSVFGKEIDNSIKENFSEIMTEDFLQLANSHGVLHIVSDAILKNKLLSDDSLLNACKKKVMQLVLLYEKMCYDLKNLSDIFEENEICHLPLKGAVLRNFYTEPWMRNSCDIDILIKKEDLEKALLLLCEKSNYEIVSKTSYDVSVKSQNGTKIELHHSLLDEDDFVYGKNSRKWNFECLDDIWETSEPEPEKKYRFKMKDEYFYFYHIAHMAKHFECGGCGLRSLVDLWILNTSCKQNTKKREECLARGNLLAFNNKMMDLCFVWFSDKPHNDFTVMLEKYIMNGGSYGTYSNSVAYGNSKSGGSQSYIKNRIWVSKEFLQKYYPNAAKKTYLIPFCQAGRWIKIIRAGRAKRSVKEIKLSQNVSDSTLLQTEKIIKELGI